MDHLIFYKKNESLKESLSRVRLSDSVTYTQFFIKELSQLSAIREVRTENVLLFYFCEDLTLDDRRDIDQLLIDFPKISVVLLSDRRFALEAWKMNVLHFDEYPVLSDTLQYGYNKWLRNQFDPNSLKELIVKSDEGVHKILYKDIHYIQAAGNYTMVHHGEGKCLVLSRQIGTFADLYENEVNFNRIHRSLILHLPNIKTCVETSVHFRSNIKPLQVSPLLITKIKKLLLIKS